VGTANADDLSTLQVNTDHSVYSVYLSVLYQISGISLLSQDGLVLGIWTWNDSKQS